MQNMEYKSDIQEAVILDEGTLNGFDYAIVSFGNHPAGYVSIPKNHPFYKKSHDDLDIVCHWGLTFSGVSPDVKPPKTGWWIGWDYAHAGDYLGFFERVGSKSFEDNKKWTTEEIKEEIQSVIEQLKKAKQ